MISLYTIGFTKKSAERFFNLIRDNGVKQLVDIRISNSSQLSGFAKGSDLDYFVKEICHIPYTHVTDFAPTKDLLDRWHKKEVTWEQYEQEYRSILKERNILKNHSIKKLNGVCFLCSEDTPDYCHRRLLAEYIKQHSKEEVTIKHLI